MSITDKDLEAIARAAGEHIAGLMDCCASCGVDIGEQNPDPWKPDRHAPLCGNVAHGWRFTIRSTPVPDWPR